MNIGILALQGDFYKHEQRLRELALEPLLVRKPLELQRCAGLIIPGGESTTMMKLMRHIGLDAAIVDFAANRAVFGTCAGAIVISREVADTRIQPLNLIDISINRNAYGRQVDSFVDQVSITTPGSPDTKLEGVFIRAPKISRVGSTVDVLGSHAGTPVWVQSEKIMAATFHPELTGSPLVHERFLELVRQHI